MREKLKNQFRIKSLPKTNSIREAASKLYVENKFIDSRKFKYDTEVNCNDKKLENINFAKINCQPAVDSHLTPKVYVDNAIETSLVRNN